jgi:hypothetical protein
VTSVDLLLDAMEIGFRVDGDPQGFFVAPVVARTTGG